MAMALFDKSSITNTEFDWFKNKLDSSFSIADDQHSKVIFGFNGIGKSTLFKCIQELRNNSVEFLEYGELRNILIKQKDLLIISPNINQIEILKSQIESLKSNYDLKKSINDSFGIKNKNQAANYGVRVQSAQKDGTFSGFVKSQADIVRIEALLSAVSPKVFFTVQSEITNVQNAQQELQNEKDHLLFHALNKINDITEDTDNICPVCGNSAANLKQTIQSKINQLSNVQSNLINKLKESNITVDANVINNLVLAQQQINANSDLRDDYILCSGSSANFSAINQNHSQLVTLQTQLSPLLIQAQTSYTNIQNLIPSLKNDLTKYFKVNPSSVVSDPSKYTVSIKFPREIKTYSTGELNLISFLYKIYSFIGSDKTILILDDPVSSLDLVNHYKIAYEIVRNASSTRTILILTHSVEFINVINSQYRRQFEYYYLEQHDDVISIQLIPNSSLGGSNPNVVTLDRLSDTPPFIGFIDALKVRETDPTNSAIQRLFHYTITAEHLDSDPSKFSNHDLISLIDNFQTFIQGDFFTNSFLKVLYLCALRLWLEMKLYNLIPSTDTNLQTRFLSAFTLNEKISCVLPPNGVPAIAFPSGLTRDILMSKKVMLNQGVHYYSQIMPFAYAINLSLDMIKEEILELKSLLP